jgi:hypothetical protein
MTVGAGVPLSFVVLIGEIGGTDGRSAVQPPGETFAPGRI